MAAKKKKQAGRPRKAGKRGPLKGRKVFLWDDQYLWLRHCSRTAPPDSPLRDNVSAVVRKLIDEAKKGGT